ncbi:Transmembrane 9 super member 2, partial [Coemansia sp. RSA 518]
MNSIWFHKVYYVFGFLFLVFCILVITTAEVTVLLTYFHLCAEDYRWHWRSVYTAGASALYVFLYGILFYFSRLRLASYASLITYFGWMAIACLLFFILTALPFLFQFAAGAIAGVSEILCMYPLDVAKTRLMLQVGTGADQYKSIVD